MIREPELSAAVKLAARVVGDLALAIARRRFANAAPAKWIADLRAAADGLERAL